MRKQAQRGYETASRSHSWWVEFTPVFSGPQAWWFPVCHLAGDQAGRYAQKLRRGGEELDSGPGVGLGLQKCGRVFS